jgi:PhoPQ-activated pathogenicity-related protein
VYAWCREKCRFVAADEWIKREWPKIIAKYSPEDTYNADETGLYFRAMPGHAYLFENNGAKRI